ncbi:MAG TPA: oxygen-independent coproporphyrinogen III oxidase [Thermoanaerobaculia bacterium]|nr:oxygen-independent coproporphyrinogen III oxidase [Thermoanaerobaculia bacterium]
MTQTNLFEKYDVPVPRYTSYPTVPFWSDDPTTDQWLGELRKAAARPDCTWAIYVHIPFCESLCTFCGCNNVITQNHQREDPYIRRVVQEFSMYMDAVPDLATRPLRQLHLGGGTPTFLSPASLTALLEPILARVDTKSEQFDASVEVNPRVTTEEHLRALFDAGFTRVSMGVQDFDPTVQYLVNRIQPFEVTKDLTDQARAMGYTSVNYDLIYGLPKQTPETMRRTAELTVTLAPDRIALYSFAKVPWIKPAQRLFKDSDLPEGPDKRQLYEIAREIFLRAGYVEIGMDHFALPHDSLHKAQVSGDLHRNFMGYTEFRTDVLLGLGVSAISESPTCFHQNVKTAPAYEERVEAGQIPTFRGHLLSEEDRRLRQQILDFMTRLHVRLEPEQVDDARDFLATMLEDGIVKLEGNELRLVEAGKPFLRNAAVFFDHRLRAAGPRPKIFSQAI